MINPVKKRTRSFASASFSGYLAESPAVDYKSFTWERRHTTEFKHLKYLYFWPIFGLLFFCAERVWIRASYFPTYCSLDDQIPFCEYFLIPYLFWFLFLIGMHAYTLFYDVEAFEGLMKFIIVSFSLSLLIFFIFPSCQELRPATFARDNVFTRFLAYFYRFDTNTNVCPSLHVVGSVAVWVCAWNSKHFGTPGWRAIFTVLALLISISTVFLKQHSVVDLIAAIPVCIAAYLYAYPEFSRHRSFWLRRRENKRFRAASSD